MSENLRMDPNIQKWMNMDKFFSKEVQEKVRIYALDAGLYAPDKDRDEVLWSVDQYNKKLKDYTESKR